jgi:hypothetical protein
MVSFTRDEYGNVVFWNAPASFLRDEYGYVVFTRNSLDEFGHKTYSVASVGASAGGQGQNTLLVASAVVGAKGGGAGKQKSANKTLTSGEGGGHGLASFSANSSVEAEGTAQTSVGIVAVSPFSGALSDEQITVEDVG